MNVRSFILQARLRCPACSHEFDYVAAPGLPTPPRSASELATVPSPAVEQQEIKTLAAPAPEAKLPAPLPPNEEAADKPIAPLITSPHCCHQCKRLINAAIGRRRTAINCPFCGQRTSVYALQYRCRHCATLLESPLNLAGFDTTCPHCREVMCVPDDVLHAEPPPEVDLSWFQVDCPSCDEPLYAARKNVGSAAVCPQCLVVVFVPRSGRHLSAAALSRPKAERRCARCQSPIPVSCDVCPLCGCLTPFANPQTD
jgi:hypothetical protein